MATKVRVSPETSAVEQAIAETMVAEPEPPDDDGLDPRVQRGAARLDRDFPGWADKIKLATFQISMSDRCVLGQVFGDFWKGLPKMYRYRIGDGVPDVAGDDGFIALDGDYDSLQRDWKTAIKARQTKTPGRVRGTR